MTLYNLKRTDSGYTMVKFDSDFNVAAIYNLSPDKGGKLACDCPAGPRPTCKHRKMIPIFLASGAVDSVRFYDYERQFWQQPIPALNEAEEEPSATKAVEAVGEAQPKPAEPSTETSIRRV